MVVPSAEKSRGRSNETRLSLAFMASKGIWEELLLLLPGETGAPIHVV